MSALKQLRVLSKDSDVIFGTGPEAEAVISPPLFHFPLQTIKPICTVQKKKKS